MKKQKYIEDLRDIKEIMDRSSSKFISLSGLSGISAGVIALIGAYAAYQTIYANHDLLGYGKAVIPFDGLTSLLIIAIATIVLSIGTGIFFTSREAKKMNQQLWDHQTKRLLINLAIPLLTGGVLCLNLLLRGHVGIIAPLTLIFYGLGLINASKYTLGEIRSLGLVEIILGLIATQFIGFGLLFWSLGFGLLHIVYGVVMQIRHKS